ncbi:MAG: hypothetical protein WDO71_11120 [Bacteroidota bacterium]
MENILIIKTGAAGDVVRTTSLLNVLSGNIYWVTSEGNKWLLPDYMPNLVNLQSGGFSIFKRYPVFHWLSPLKKIKIAQGSPVKLLLNAWQEYFFKMIR